MLVVVISYLGLAIGLDLLYVVVIKAATLFINVCNKLSDDIDRRYERLDRW